MQQPVLGVVASAIVVALSLGFISLFDFPTFLGWVSTYALCFIPMQVVVGVIWHSDPPFTAGLGQPAKGIALSLVTLAAGVVATIAIIATAGAGVTPPGPIVAFFTIACIVTTFWWAIMFGGWPFTALMKNRIAAGLTMLAAVYVVATLLFRTFFNFTFLQGAPVYIAAADPGGLFNAWYAATFCISVVAAMFFVVLFDLWPITRVAALATQPARGLAWAGIALGVAAVTFYLGVVVLGTDVVAFLVQVPIPFIFGSIVVLNMLQHSLFAGMAQPLKGVLNVLCVVVVGVGLSWLYLAVAPVVTGTLAWGPPTHDLELWLANALLSVTFPLLIFSAEFFKLWPLAPKPSQATKPTKATQTT